MIAWWWLIPAIWGGVMAGIFVMCLMIVGGESEEGRNR